MKHKKTAVKNAEVKGKKETLTCVCNMEWRGTHEDEWGDCICYSQEQDKAEN